MCSLAVVGAGLTTVRGSEARRLMSNLERRIGSVLPAVLHALLTLTERLLMKSSPESRCDASCRVRVPSCVGGREGLRTDVASLAALPRTAGEATTTVLACVHLSLAELIFRLSDGSTVALSGASCLRWA